MIFDARRACRIFSMNSSRFPSKTAFSLGYSLAAATLSSFMAERQRAKTASLIRVRGTPSSRAETLIHFPVPFWPAVSRILSTRGFPSSSL